MKVTSKSEIKAVVIQILKDAKNAEAFIHSSF